MKHIFTPEKIFVILALIFGLIFTVIIPPFQSPDEFNHIERIYAITQGQFMAQKPDTFSSGSYLPSSLSVFYKKNSLNQEGKTSFKRIFSSASVKEGKEKIFYSYINTALYSPLAYLPSVTGIKTAQIFTSSFLWMMILGKLFNLIFYITLGYFAIKSVPFLKWLTILILLAPINLSLASSLSTDPVLLSSSILFFAKILQYSFEKDKKIGNKQVLFLCLLSILIALVKQNFLIVLFAFLIPKDKFEGNYLSKMLMIIMPGIFLSFLWGRIAISVLVPGNGSNPPAQLAYILNHPIDYLETFFRTSRIFSRMLKELVGVLGLLTLKLAPSVYIIYPIFFILNTLFCYESASKLILPLRKRLLLLTLILLIIFVINTNMYLVWTHVGEPIIEGIQGRYFAPILLPAAAFVAMSLRVFRTNKIVQYSTLTFAIILLSHTVYKIYNYFYI